MWARTIELLIAAWLIYSQFFFDSALRCRNFWINILICSSLITLFSLLSFSKRFEKAHLFSLIVAFWLVLVGYYSPLIPPPFSLQNVLICGLLLGLFALVPSHANEPPQSWRRFYSNKK